MSQEEHLAYWQQRLAGAPACLELPADRPRPRVQTSKGACYTFRLPRSLVDALTALGNQAGATLFMILLAAFQALLARYTDQTDIVVGTPVADYVPAASLLSLAINLLALRTDLSGDPTVREMLRRVREVVLEAYAHSDTPLDLVLAQLRPADNLGGAPLIQTAFSLHHAPPAGSVNPNRTGGETGAAQLDLALTLQANASGLQGDFEYNTDLFDPATLERMAGHFQTLLESFVANPDRPLSTLALMGEDEQRQVLLTWNAARASPRQTNCVHARVAAQATRTPDAAAVVFAPGDGRPPHTLTYGALNVRANQLAHHLQELGVRSEVRVAVCLERSIELIVGLLGVLKSGGAYVPFDPTYPAERKAFMLEDSQATVLLTQTSLRASTPPAPAGVNLICLDADWPAIAPSPDVNLPVTLTPANLVNVIYTSGSTGTPKGVGVEQRGLLNLIDWHQDTFAVTDRDRATQLAGLAFDASVWEMWPCLTAGASLHLPDEDTRASPTHLHAWLIDQAITITFLPTPLAENVIALAWPPATALRFMLTGGDRLHYHPPVNLPFELVNNYGPTENSVVTTSGKVPASANTGRVPAIGRPITNTQVYILDTRLRPVPIGVPGELCIGGVSLARGYLNRPEWTAEKFVPNPFVPPLSQTGEDTGGGGDRLYRTGDLARWLPNGEIEFIGRIDHQVKVRGFRIELGEIETVLRQHPGVQEAVVTAWEDTPGAKRLVAHVVPRAEPPSPHTLRTFLQTRLPDYMLPAAFVTLDALPLTQNGKVDRRALPAPDLASEYVAPRTNVELTLAGMWCESLQLDRVGVHDNLLELGGTSLSATQIVSRIRQTFQVELTVRRLFETPTVAALAQALIAAESQPGRTEKIARAWQRIKHMPDAEIRQALQHKKKNEVSR